MEPIKGIQKGYSRYHFFEFANGEVSIRNIVKNAVRHVHKYFPFHLLKSKRTAILSEVIGNAHLSDCTLVDVILQRHPVSEFPASKIESLKEKYFSIPAEFLNYYPVVNDENVTNRTPSERSSIRAKDAFEGLKRKRVGRPLMDKEVEVILFYCVKSILNSIGTYSQNYYVSSIMTGNYLEW